MLAPVAILSLALISLLQPIHILASPTPAIVEDRIVQGVFRKVLIIPNDEENVPIPDESDTSARRDDIDTEQEESLESRLERHSKMLTPADVLQGAETNQEILDAISEFLLDDSNTEKP